MFGKYEMYYIILYRFAINLLKTGLDLCCQSSSYYYLHMNIIMLVITEDITNIQITVSVYVSTKLLQKVLFKKKNWFILFFVDLLQLI